MPKFISLTMFIDQEGSKKTSSPKMAQAAPFLEWKEGYRIASKNSRDTVFTIKSIANPDNPVMSYKASVEIQDDTGDDLRVLRGSTLQSGYVFIDHGSVQDDALKATAKSIGINADKIRNFYPRRDGRPGCRVILDGGVSYAVAEDFDRILALLDDKTTVTLLDDGVTVTGRVTSTDTNVG